MEVTYSKEQEGIVNEERIHRYLTGSMDAEEESAFIEELHTNQELKEQALTIAHLLKGMKDANESLKDAFRKADDKTIREILDTLDKEIAVAEQPTRKISLRRLAIAACLVLAVFVGYKGYDYHHTTSLGQEYATEFTSDEFIRGDRDSSAKEKINKLFKNIEICTDLTSTLTELQKLWSEANSDTYNDYTEYAPYIGWHLAVGYLEDNDKDAALNVLDEMQKQYPESTAMGNKVKELREKI